MKEGTWKTTGPGHGTWQTGDPAGPWLVALAAVIAIAAVGRAAWHARTQLELIFAGGVAFLVVAVTALIVVYRLLHRTPRRKGQAEITAGRPAIGLTTTAVPQVVTAAAVVPQALPAPTVVVNLVIGGDAATALLNGAQPVVRVVPEAREIQP